MQTPQCRRIEILEVDLRDIVVKGHENSLHGPTSVYATNLQRPHSARAERCMNRCTTGSEKWFTSSYGLCLVHSEEPSFWGRNQASARRFRPAPPPIAMRSVPSEARRAKEGIT